MARDQNTVAKRLREVAKKRKQEEKRASRRQRKDRVEPVGSNNPEQDGAQDGEPKTQEQA